MGSAFARQPLLQGFQGQAAHRNHPFLAPLAEDADEGSIIAVHGLGHVSEVQADHFAHPCSGPVEELEQGAIAQHGRSRPHHGAQQLARLVLAEGLREQVGDRYPGNVHRRI